MTIVRSGGNHANSGKRCSRVRTPAADSFAAPCGPPRLPARRIPGSDLPEWPFAHARAIFEGVAPAPLLFRPSCADRPAQIRNSLLNKALALPRVFRGGAKPASRMHGECFVAAFSPKQRTTVPKLARPQPPSGEKGIVTALQACAVPAFNHALVRDQAVDPRHGVRVQLPCLLSSTYPGRDVPERRFSCISFRMARFGWEQLVGVFMRRPAVRGWEARAARDDPRGAGCRAGRRACA